MRSCKESECRSDCRFGCCFTAMWQRFYLQQVLILSRWCWRRLTQLVYGGSWNLLPSRITANCFSFSWGERPILPCRGGVGLWLRCCGNWGMWIRNYRPRHECRYCSYLCLVFSCNVGRGVLKKTCSWSQVRFQSLMIWSKLSVLPKVVRFP